MMKLSDNQYNTMKWLVILFLPALAALYAGLADVWGLPYPEQLPRTINYIQVFLGTIIGISTINYNKEGE